MLLSSKNDESDGIKIFEVYSSYITLASSIFKQTKNANLCYGLYRRKSVTFEMRIPFLYLRPCKKYTSFLNEITCRVSAKYCFIKKYEFCIPYVSVSELAQKCKVTDKQLVLV